MWQRDCTASAKTLNHYRLSALLSALAVGEMRFLDGTAGSLARAYYGGRDLRPRVRWHWPLRYAARRVWGWLRGYRKPKCLPVGKNIG